MCLKSLEFRYVRLRTDPLRMILHSAHSGGYRTSALPAVMQLRSQMNVLQTHRILKLRSAAAIAGALALAACASAPPPTASLQAAQQAIGTAEQANAGQ